MPTLRVFSRQGCHLCELLLEELLPLVRGRARVEVVDIDLDPALESVYGRRIPVVELDGCVLSEFHLDTLAVENSIGVGVGVRNTADE